MTLRLRHLAQINPPTPEFDRLPVGADVTFMPLEAVWGDGRFDATRRRSKSAVVSGYTRFREGDILLPKVTPTFQAGRAAIAKDLVNGVGAGSTELHVLRSRDGVDPRFVWYVAQSEQFLGRGVASFQGVAGLQRVPEDFVKEFPVADFKLDEQRRIADFLDLEVSRLDSLAAGRRRQIDLFRQRLMSIWSKEIEDASDSWIPIRRFILSITDGPFGSALTSGHYSVTGTRVIRLGNVGLGEFRPIDEAYIPNSYFLQLRKHEALPGDLVVAGLGDESHPLGRACVLPNDLGAAIVKADCFRLRLDQQRLNHEYAALAISSPVVVDQTRLLARGSTRSRINLEVLRDVRLPIPSIRVQMEIVGRLRERQEESRRVIERLLTQLALLAERRQALITAAVTGHIDVTVALEVSV